MDRPLRALTYLCAVALSAGAWAQSAGTGFRLWGPLGGTDTYLVDDTGTIVHTWPSQFLPGASCYLQPDGLLLRSTKVGSQLGPLGDGGGLQRVELDGTVVWDYRYSRLSAISHHDVALMPNGNVLMIAWEARGRADAIGNGRDPAITPDLIFWPDHIIEVQQTGPTTGRIVWQWHVFDHLIQDFDPARANYGVVADNPQLIDINHPYEIPDSGDFNHMNSIDYDPVHDWIVVSAREQDEFWIIDHSTSTLEAAGHTGGRHGKGGDLIYRWGNPEAYGRGTPADRQLFAQHGPVFIPEGYPGAGNILVFSNQSPGGSHVLEVALPLDANGDFIEPPAGVPYGPAAPVWSYTNPFLNSANISNAVRLPNGNTLICSGAQGWMFEISPSQQLVWQFVTNLQNAFHVHYYDHHLWVDERSISVTLGGSAQFDLKAGSRFAGRPFLLLGSLTGTGPGIDIGGPRLLPLEYDGYLVFTVSTPNQFPLAYTSPTLDASGNASVSFSLPPGLASFLIGLRIHHAAVVFGAGGAGVELVSNPVTIELKL
ncbi:MAG: aryl-sulfate sulfotransferase [Planctomycetes bacterium]|nr:aryl-sulfate sulfotransferase [Planctomycetota bacterium]